jgi:hypothetical protein
LDRNLIDNATWALPAPFLPPIRGRACRPAIDNRQVLEGIFWIARTGSPCLNASANGTLCGAGLHDDRAPGSMRKSWRRLLQAAPGIGRSK